MKTKAVVFLAPDQPSIEEVSLPDQLKPDQLLIRIAYSGVSIGTEQSIFSGIRNTQFPVAPGYMAAGTVEKAGAESGFVEGENVICTGAQLAADCKVKNSWAGHSAFQVAAANDCARIPSGVDLKEAAMFILPAVGLNAANLAGVQMEDTVLVQGQGLIGQFFGQWCRNRGAKVIAIEPDPIRRDLSRRLVTPMVIDPKSEDVGARIAELTGGKGPTIVTESTASAKLISEATRHLRYGGKMVFLSWYPGEINIDFGHFHYNQIRAYFPCGFGGAESARATLTGLASGAIQMRENLTDIYPFEKACEGYQRIIARDGSILGMVIDWRNA